MELKFAHDPKKAKTNLRKHGVSFTEAGTSFYDPFALSGPDEAHSEPGDERRIHIGLSLQGRLPFVVHNEDESGFIHIISARVASPTQRNLYEEN